MKVFLTGATGFIGSAVARALRERGHDIIGLARSEASAQQLRAASIEPFSGSLEDQDSLRRGVAHANAIVHAGFGRDYLDDLEGTVALERSAIYTIIDALQAEDKPFVYTSGLGVVGDTGDRVVTEDTPIQPPAYMTWRRELELLVLNKAQGIVIRPPLVYGRAGGHVLTMMIRTAIRRGGACYPAPGTNVWPNVHVDDLGRAYALAIEKAPPGTLLNVVGGESTSKAMSEAIGHLIGKPDATSALPLHEAIRELPIAEWMTVTQRIDARRVRELLDWQPHELTVTDDIAFGSYRSLLSS